MSDFNSRVFLLTLGGLPLGCGSTVVPIDQGPGDGSTSGPGPLTGSSEEAASAATSSDSSSSTSDGSTSTDPGSDSTSADRDATESSSSSSSGEPGLCEQWAEVNNACNGDYDVGYLEDYCYYYLSYMDCSVERAAVIECEAGNGGPCSYACEAELESVDVCLLMLEAEELGCYDLDVLVPDGTMETQCSDLASFAFACDAAGTYIGGFSQYADYVDPVGAMTDHCMYGAYWVFWGPDPESSCGAAYEDLLACVNQLSCTELEDEVYEPTECETEAIAAECKCDLGIG